MKNILRYAWLMVLSLGLIAMAIAIYNGVGSTMTCVEVTVLILTLSVLTRYAFDTNRLADASEKHLGYLSTPVVTASVERQVFEPASAKAVNPTTVFYVTNDSRYQLEFKVRIVLQYGGHTNIHTDRYYSGEATWNIGPNDISHGNFEILPFFREIGDNSDTMADKLQKTDQRLSIFIFSKYRIFGSNVKTYTRNMTRTYWLKHAEVPKSVAAPANANLLPFVWVLEFDAPPEAVVRSALEDF